MMRLAGITVAMALALAAAPAEARDRGVDAGQLSYDVAARANITGSGSMTLVGAPGVLENGPGATLSMSGFANSMEFDTLFVTVTANRGGGAAGAEASITSTSSTLGDATTLRGAFASHYDPSNDRIVAGAANLRDLVFVDGALHGQNKSLGRVDLPGGQDGDPVRRRAKLLGVHDGIAYMVSDIPVVTAVRISGDGEPTVISSTQLGGWTGSESGDAPLQRPCGGKINAAGDTALIFCTQFSLFGAESPTGTTNKVYRVSLPSLKVTAEQDFDLGMYFFISETAPVTQWDEAASTFFVSIISGQDNPTALFFDDTSLALRAKASVPVETFLPIASALDAKNHIVHVTSNYGLALFSFDLSSGNLVGSFVFPNPFPNDPANQCRSGALIVDDSGSSILATVSGPSYSSFAYLVTLSGI